MKLTPIASMRTSASPRAGFGLSTSTYSSTSGPPVFETRIAFMGGNDMPFVIAHVVQGNAGEGARHHTGNERRQRGWGGGFHVVAGVLARGWGGGSRVVAGVLARGRGNG